MPKQAFLYQPKTGERIELHVRNSPDHTVQIFPFPNVTLLAEKMSGADMSHLELNEVFESLRSTRLWQFSENSDQIISELSYGILPLDTFSSSYNFDLCR